MFQDIGVSKDLNEQFKKHLTNSEPLDCEYAWVSKLPLQAGFSEEVALFVASERDGGCPIRNSGTGKQEVLPTGTAHLLTCVVTGGDSLGSMLAFPGGPSRAGGLRPGPEPRPLLLADVAAPPQAFAISGLHAQFKFQ